MRIFLDANILFSAAKSDGAVRRLVGLLSAAGHELCADGYVIEEARRNLQPKYPASLVSFNKILAVLEVSAIIPKDPPDYGAGLPEKDRPVLASAIALECAALVTGDMTHFGHLYGTSVAGVSIHSPSSIAAHLLVE